MVTETTKTKKVFDNWSFSHRQKENIQAYVCIQLDIWFITLIHSPLLFSVKRKASETTAKEENNKYPKRSSFLIVKYLAFMNKFKIMIWTND